MKILFILVAAFLVAGTSAQDQGYDIGADLQQISNAISQATSTFTRNFADNLNALANSALNLVEAAWKTFRSFSFGSVSYANSGITITINNVINMTREAIRNDEVLRNATQSYFDTARQLYNQAISDYFSLRNVSIEIYQCWNASRPQIVQVLRTFVNTTTVQSQPSVSQFNDYSLQQHLTLAGNVTAYQGQLFLQCSWRIFSYRSCVDTFWTNNRAGLEAAFINFRINMASKRNETYTNLRSIINNNAEIARNDLTAIDNAFELCVNNTLTTTTTTTLAP